MSAALTFKIGLNDCARVMQGDITSAADLESFQLNRHQVIRFLILREYGYLYIS